MTFIASKLLWALIQPSHLLLLGLVVVSVLLLLGWRRWATALALTLTAALLLVLVLPLGTWLLRPLEERFPPPATPPQEVAGIILLGGGTAGGVGPERPHSALNEGGERLAAFVALARRYPQARLVSSGGFGSLVPGQVHPAAQTRGFFAEQGLDPARVLHEDRSRNTFENALLTKALAAPQPGERWLLVTSAAHMPRAIGIFRRIGWPVDAYPVDYRTPARLPAAAWTARLVQPDLAWRLHQLDQAVHAWVGLAAYWLMDRTSALLPAP